MGLRTNGRQERISAIYGRTILFDRDPSSPFALSPFLGSPRHVSQHAVTLLDSLVCGMQSETPGLLSASPRTSTALPSWDLTFLQGYSATADTLAGFLDTRRSSA